MDNSKVFAMKLSKVYPLLVAKAQRKGRTVQEVEEVLFWLTGYDKAGLDAQLEKNVDYGAFFEEAPCMNPSYHRITGSICGVKVQDIEDPLMQKIRYLDKLVDELAEGKPMEKILRNNDHWPYSTIDKSALFLQISFVEKLLLKCGAEYAGVSQEKNVWHKTDGSTVCEIRKQNIWHRNGVYIRVNWLYFSEKPFLVLEFSGNPKGPYEDADPFPYDLREVDLEAEVKLALGI